MQYKYSLSLIAYVNGLEIADNCDDERFPYIVKSKPVIGGQ